MELFNLGDLNIIHHILHYFILEQICDQWSFNHDITFPESVDQCVLNRPAFLSIVNDLH